MNRKGFTLIEMILVIALLAVIAIILVPITANIIEKNKINTYNNTIDSVESATKLYIADNRYESLFINLKCNDTTTLSIKKLVDEGYLKETPAITEPSVTITYNCSSKDYTIKWLERK